VSQRVRQFEYGADRETVTTLRDCDMVMVAWRLAPGQSAGHCPFKRKKR
jgi:hypothetical protein